MAGVREHLGECPVCRLEYQSLADTKQLLSSLARRASRAEIEALLQADDVSGRAAPLGGQHRSFLRPRPLAATALLSVAGLWLATTALDRGSPDADAGAAAPTAAATLNAGVLPAALSPSFIRSAVGATPAVPFPAAPAPAGSVSPAGSLLGVSTSQEMPASYGVGAAPVSVYYADPTYPASAPVRGSFYVAR